MAAKAEAAAIETATSLLGEARGKTALDLARLPVAAEITETLSAIRSAIDGFQDVAPGESQSVTPQETLVVQPSERTVSANGRIDFFGIMVPAGRASEAEDVIAAARTAVAQNHKTNPYDHYRGKNAWFKSLFLAAFSHITAEAVAPLPSSGAVHRDEGAKPLAADEADPPSRPSVVAAGPVRGPRPGYFVRREAFTPDTPALVPSPAPPPMLQPTGNRLHAHGTTAQTIPEEVLQQSAAQQPPARGRQTFFRNRKV